MKTVTLSPKYQIVIPRSIRNSLNLIPGQKMTVIALKNRIELIPHHDIADMRGFLKGIDTRIDREEDRL